MYFAKKKEASGVIKINYFSKMYSIYYKQSEGKLHNA